MMMLYIVCNNLPANLVSVASGPGMRAEQLFLQAKAAGFNVQYLMFVERYFLTSSKYDLYNSNKGILLIPRNKFEDFTKNIEPSVFVFTLANFPDELEVASLRHHIIYDCFARKDLELLHVDQNKANDYTGEERRCIQFSSSVLAGSNKLKNYIDQKYSISSIVLPIAFSPSTRQKFLIPTVCFGGRFQSWANFSQSLETICDYLEAKQQHRGFFFYNREVKTTENSYAKAVGRLLTLSNVTCFNLLPTTIMSELVGGSHLFVDFSLQNDERVYATSIRTVHAISLHTPAVHNIGSALDDWFAKFPGWLGNDFTVDVLADAIESSFAGDFDSSLDSAGQTLEATLCKVVLNVDR